jgi:hypothetical protein
VSGCRVDWDAFDLDPPDPDPCGRTAEYRVTQGCIHEHVQEALVCDHHLGVMRGYLPLGQWACGRCVTERRHVCPAPVVALPLREDPPP